jgi:cystinosin
VKNLKILKLEIRGNYFFSTSLNQEVSINFTQNHHDLIALTPDFVKLPTNQTYNFNISLQGLSPGHVDVTGTANPKDIIDDTNLFFRIIVANSRIIIYISLIVGWVYFVAWSISFYPQIWINYKRKSVVGLSFDFMALNFMGHTLYAIFNVCLYFVPFFQEEYFLRFPRGTNPVELNDVFFSIHASFITALTISQCFFYEVKENYLIPQINQLKNYSFC